MNYNINENKIYKKIIDAKTASEIMGISRSTVYKMVERKKIDYIEYPDSIRFYESDILNYIENHKIRAVNDF